MQTKPDRDSPRWIIAASFDEREHAVLKRLMAISGWNKSQAVKRSIAAMLERVEAAEVAGS